MKTVQRPGLGPQATLGGGDGSGRALRVSGETRSRASPGPSVGEAVQEERPDRGACQEARKGEDGGESEIGFIPGRPLETSTERSGGHSGCGWRRDLTATRVHKTRRGAARETVRLFFWGVWIK